MKRFDLALILIGSAVTISPALAASTAMPGMGDMDGKSVVAATHGFMAHGILDSVNPAGTVKITHQAIKALGWPAMTMVFGVQKPSLLKGLEPGQTVNFDLAKTPSGKYVVTRIGIVK